MSVHCPDYLLNCSFQLKPHASLRYQLCCVWADYVRPKHLVVSGIADHLDQPFGCSNYLGLAYHRHREAANLDFVTALPGLSFRQPDACNLRQAICATWNVIVVQRLRILIGNGFHRNDPLCRSDMCKQGCWHNVPNRIYPRLSRPHMRVYFDITSLDFNPRVLQPQPICVSATANSNQELFSGEFAVCIAYPGLDLDQAAFLHCGLEICIRER